MVLGHGETGGRIGRDQLRRRIGEQHALPMQPAVQRLHHQDGGGLGGWRERRTVPGAMLIGQPQLVAGKIDSGDVQQVYAQGCKPTNEHGQEPGVGVGRARLAGRPQVVEVRCDGGVQGAHRAIPMMAAAT